LAKRSKLSRTSDIENGVELDLKILAVKEFPRPQTNKNIKQFLGFAGYYG